MIRKKLLTLFLFQELQIIVFLLIIHTFKEVYQANTESIDSKQVQLCLKKMFQNLMKKKLVLKKVMVKIKHRVLLIHKVPKFHDQLDIC